MNELERFNNLKQKIDVYNAQVIELEVKKKNAQEEYDKLLSDLKQLGYSSLEEATQSLQVMQEDIDRQLNEMEEKLKEV